MSRRVALPTPAPDRREISALFTVRGHEDRPLTRNVEIGRLLAAHHDGSRPFPIVPVPESWIDGRGAVIEPRGLPRGVSRRCRRRSHDECPGRGMVETARDTWVAGRCTCACHAGAEG